ncbi:beta-mannanase [Pontibacter aydingkolensis]|uniref:GH26 domain-containing protein n=1 Tax=Pontibacter aydingkolensis TaxID=1911536 RepID=A0ABS7CTI7_9BACT|nr:hypothetical protein [Pontibacter aydingkolensis]MBW7467166.1 hypothetical protein [Pontibacter aydingkolensis]
MKTGLRIILILTFVSGMLFLFKIGIHYNKRHFISDELAETPNQLIIGSYDDYCKQNLNIPTGSLKIYTFKWLNPDTMMIREQLYSTLTKGQAVLLTIELLDKQVEDATDANVLQALLNGVYDNKIRAMCHALIQNQDNIYLRWNPDMEVPSEHYYWQNQAPALYIKAFRYFAKKCKTYIPNAKIVWGPAGFPGTLEYWPGADVVDFSSVTINSPSEISTPVKYPSANSKTELIKRKLHRLRFIQKPIIVILSNQIKKDIYTEKDVKDAALAIEAFNKDSLIRIKQVQSRQNIPVRFTSRLTKEQESKANLKVGVYDPLRALTDHKSVSVEHIFTNWTDIKNGKFRRQFKEASARKHDVIVTMEPWRAIRNEKDRAVLAKVIQGKFDNELAELYRIISNTDRTVYLRWAHEMEIPIVRYPWQSQDPHLYIKSYRYFVKQKPFKTSNIRFVWGPAGDRGSLEWWPGDDVTDYISIAIYGLPDKNITDHRLQETFEAILNRKLYRMRFVNKPIFITEFGVKGPEKYQMKWMSEAAITLNKHPQVIGICYFNMVDSPKAWGEIDAPKWNISTKTFESFTKTLARPH